MNESIEKFLNNEVYILAYRSNYDSAREVNQQLIDYIKDLRKQNTELKDNWNKLKEWLEEEIKYDENWYKPECKEYIGQKRYPDDTIDGFNYVLDKLQEIEGGMNE